ncbi:MAG: hypothetical protein NXI01_02095 [Gammaproteobacteria bacterium]|nr:hypothetical protein [Gammaproteobacteria bacterium]
MKKNILFLLLCFPLIGLACDQCHCFHRFNIVIQNNTPVICHVTQTEVEVGTVVSKKFPAQVSVGETAVLSSIQTNYADRAKMRFSLQCGEDKFVTFDSERTLDFGFFSETEHVLGSIVSLSNMDASYRGDHEQCKKSIPSTIYWDVH